MTQDRHASLGIHRGSSAAPGGIPRIRTLRRASRFAVGTIAVLVLGAALGVAGRLAHSRDLRAATRRQQAVYVATTVVHRARAGATVDLPGTLQGYFESPIYARASGYVRKWYRDIGARVGKGALLAVIETPELDQELQQAVADRARAAAARTIANITAQRWAALQQHDAVSRQAADEKRSAAEQAQAALAAADANVRRLRALKGFQRVLAPYAGVITRRDVDVGDLVNAGNGGFPSALFHIAQIDPLRLYIDVPQRYAPSVRIDEPVTVTQSELATPLHGKVVRTARAIDPVTRTLQVEVDLPNRDGRLLPGAYVEARVPVGATGTLLAPDDALLFRAAGPQIAVVDANGRVHLKAVSLGRDMGRTIEILRGLRDGDRIVRNPPDSLADGDVVTVQAATTGDRAQ